MPVSKRSARSSSRESSATRLTTRTSTWQTRADVLTEIVGGRSAANCTRRARATNQVATDLAMFVRGHAHAGQALCSPSLLEVLGRSPPSATLFDWPSPAHTPHLPAGQPVYLGHHMLAYFWMFFRDARRFKLVISSTVTCRPAPARSPGSTGTHRSPGLADELGFARPHPNSLDAVSNRDCALDYLYSAAACAMHLSRLGSEIVLWSSKEFGFCEPADLVASARAFMRPEEEPRRRPPSCCAGKGSRIAASLYKPAGHNARAAARLQQGHAEDKEPLFDSVDNLELCLEVAAKMLGGLSFRPRAPAGGRRGRPARRDRHRRPSLVRDSVPFREAHGIVGCLARTAIERGFSLAELQRP